MRLRLLILMLLLFTLRGVAQDKGVAHVLLPVNLTGTLNGADYAIRAPANWNGTLLVFAHGFTSPSVAVTPVAIPPVQPSLEEQLLAQGYALAASNFRSAEKDGVLQTIALTNFFNGAVGNPARVILWSVSLGSGVGLKLIEKYPGIYAGLVAGCAPGAGIPENMDEALSFDLAYAAVFGWHDEAWGPIENLKDNLNFANDVLPILIAEAYPGPATFGRWEFIRLVMHMSQQQFWTTDPQLQQPMFLLHMWKGTERRSIIEADNGGPVAGNGGMAYTLSDQEKQYLGNLGVNADARLSYMNERTKFAAAINARNRLQEWAGFSGLLQRPVLTIHSKFDGLLFVENESYYAAMVDAKGSNDRLVQAYVNTVGHCPFSADQYKAAIAAMDNWIQTGVRPDESMLPASLGFDLAYVPGPWVY